MTTYDDIQRLCTGPPEPRPEDPPAVAAFLAMPLPPPGWRPRIDDRWAKSGAPPVGMRVRPDWADEDDYDAADDALIAAATGEPRTPRER